MKKSVMVMAKLTKSLFMLGIAGAFSLIVLAFISPSDIKGFFGSIIKPRSTVQGIAGSSIPPPPELVTISWEDVTPDAASTFIDRLKAAPDAWKTYKSERALLTVSAPLADDLTIAKDCAGMKDEKGTCFDMVSYIPGYQHRDPERDRLFIIEPTYFDDNWIAVVTAREEKGDTLDNWIKRHVTAGGGRKVEQKRISVGPYAALEAVISGGKDTDLVVTFARYPETTSSEIYRSAKKDSFTFILVEGPDRYAVATMRLPNNTREEFLGFYKYMLETLKFE